jgi:hypothetical protein
MATHRCSDHRATTPTHVVARSRLSIPTDSPSSSLLATALCRATPPCCRRRRRCCCYCCYCCYYCCCCCCCCCCCWCLRSGLGSTEPAVRQQGEARRIEDARAAVFRTRGLHGKIGQFHFAVGSLPTGAGRLTSHIRTFDMTLHIPRRHFGGFRLGHSTTHQAGR